METKKSKVFTKRIISLFLSVLMVFSCFSGAITANATVGQNRWDTAIGGKNWIDWVNATNDQACEALLDAADEFLGKLDLSNLAQGTLPLTGIYDVGTANVKVYYTVALGNKVKNYTNQGTMDKSRVYLYVKAQAGSVVAKEITVSGYADSVDGIIDLLCALKEELIDNASVLGINLVSTLAGDQVNGLDWSVFTSSSGALSRSKAASTTATSVCGRSWRTNMSAKAIIQGALKFLNDNLTKNDDNNLIYSLLQGSLKLGVVDDMLKLYKYPDGLIDGITPMWDNWSGASGSGNGLVAYNLVASLLFNKTDWFTQEEIDSYAPNSSGELQNFEYDRVLFDKLSTQLLQKINIQITYPNIVYYEAGYDGTEGYRHDSSGYRRYRIEKVMAASGSTFAEAAATVAASEGITIDTNLKYSEENTGNILLFNYNGIDPLVITKTDTLYAFAMRALRIAWKTALEPTLGLLQVNYNGHESDGYGTNFDNVYHEWFTQSDTRKWNYSDVAANYTDAYVQQWATEMIAEDPETGEKAYNFDTAADFLDAVKNTYSYDRAAVADEDAEYNWRDIEVTSLFNQVRYSPLADLYFDVQTGPLNLYFEQTGIPSISAFMNDASNYTKYASIPEALNDFLIAAAADFFPETANTGYATRDAATKEVVTDSNGKVVVNDIQRPDYTATTTWSTTTLATNIYKALEYTGNCTNANILNPYYKNNGISAATAYAKNANNIGADLEDALIPLGIAALKQWNLTASIHDTDFDKVRDIEGLAVISLEEYLGYVFPERDYSFLWTTEEVTRGSGKTFNYIVANSGEDIFDDCILLMARDALGYVLECAGVPITKLDTNRTPWDPDTMWAQTDKTDPWQLANSVALYFLGNSTDTFDKAGTKATAKGIGAILGLVNSSGTSTLNTSTTGIWANLNAIINRILPVVGELQYVNGSYKGSGNFDSEKFLVGTIIEDVKTFNIEDLLDGLYRIVSAAPIRTNGVENTVYYKILAPVLNGLLGVNPGNSGSIQLLNTASNSAPFDYLLRKNTYGILYAGNYRGLVGSLVHNLYLLLATGNTVNDVYTTIAFALCSLGVPSQLGEQDIKGLGLELLNPVIYGTDADTTLYVRNDSYGLNKFFHNASDQQKEASRYWIKVTNLKLMDANGSTVQTFINSSTTFAPEQIREYSISRTVTANSMYTIEATYDIYYDDVLVNNNAAANTKIASGLKNRTYMYVTSEEEATQAQNDVTFSSSGSLATADDGSFKGSTVTSAAASQVKMTASSAYILKASNAADGGYQVRFDNANTSADATVSRVYMAPGMGCEYYAATYSSATGKYTLGAAPRTVTSATDYTHAYVYLDAEGYLYDQDGNKLYSWEDAPTGHLYGVIKHEETDEETEETKTVYDAALVNARNASVIAANYRYGTPAGGVTLTNFAGTKVEKESAKGVALIASGSTKEGKYTVNLVAQVGTAYATLQNILLAFTGDHDALKTAVNDYIALLNDGSVSDTSILYSGYQAANIENATAANIDYFVTTDARREALTDAMEAASKTRATAVEECINDFKSLEEVDYYARSFDALDDFEEDRLESLVTSELVTKEDENGNVVPDYDEEGNEQYTYASTAPSFKINEYVRQYNLYKSYLIARPHTLTRISGELAHATSPCDEFDEVIGTGYTVSDFTATPTTAKRTYYDMDAQQYTSGNVASYQFAYTTKDKNRYPDAVKVYDISTSLADGTDVKFGAIEGGKLVNANQEVDGKNVRYTEDSWNAYIDALGEVITSINNAEAISDTYTATTHLVMAENNLEIEEVPDGITVSGTVTIATSLDGESGEDGIVGIDVYVDVNSEPVATTAADGTFTAVIPSGTTELILSNHLFENGEHSADSEGCTIDRTVTLSGTASVEGAVIPIIVCDYNADGAVTSADKGLFNRALNARSGDANWNVYCNLNGDAAITSADKGIFNRFNGKVSKAYQYQEKALD